MFEDAKKYTDRNRAARKNTIKALQAFSRRYFELVKIARKEGVMTARYNYSFTLIPETRLPGGETAHMSIDYANNVEIRLNVGGYISNTTWIKIPENGAMWIGGEKSWGDSPLKTVSYDHVTSLIWKEYETILSVLENRLKKQF